MAKKERPRDPNQLAKLIVDIATGEIEESTEINQEEDPSEGRLVARKYWKEENGEKILVIEYIGMPNQVNRIGAAQMGRKGGLKGGKARAESLSPEKRKEIAKKAAAKRWKKDY